MPTLLVGLKGEVECGNCPDLLHVNVAYNTAVICLKQLFLNEPLLIKWCILPFLMVNSF